jgi:hypothetical protein
MRSRSAPKKNSLYLFFDKDLTISNSIFDADPDFNFTEITYESQEQYGKIY